MPITVTFCLQRLTCALSLLLTGMLANIMFYGIPKDPNDQLAIGPLKLSWDEFRIGKLV